jgi:hypothetical protein
MRLKVAAALVLLGLAVSPAFAFPIFGLHADVLDINAGLMLIGSAPPAGYGQGSTVVQLIGVGMPIQLPRPFFIEPDIEFYGWPYAWTGSAAVPTSTDDGWGFFILGTIISLQGGLSYPVSSAITLGGSLGLDFVLRFPAEIGSLIFLGHAMNTSSKVQSDQGSAMGYMYGAGRFFYPETRFFMKWALSDSLSMLVNLRAWYPIFHLWDGEGLPFIDQFMISAGLGFEFHIEPPPAK